MIYCSGWDETRRRADEDPDIAITYPAMDGCIVPAYNEEPFKTEHIPTIRRRAIDGTDLES